MLGSVRSTLLAYLALALAISAVQASGEFHHVQRNHVNLKRIVKKRSPQLGGKNGIPIAAANDPAENPPNQITPTTPAPSVTNTAVTDAPTSIPSTSDSSSSSNSNTSSASSSSSDGGLLGGLISGGILGLSSSSSSSSSSSVSSSTTTSSASQAPVSSSSSTSTSATHKPTVTVVANQDPEQATAVPKPTGAALVKSTTLMILIVIASSLGGIAILWTVFRKWKLGRSSKFNERLQPIDWQPTDGEREDGIAPAVRRAPSNASSFHSASAHGHANGGAGGRTSPLQPIPDHDFTAGAAPIGGYADLARGPSPPMGEVNRGATMGRGYEYDTGVPLHHQAGPGAYAAYDYQGSRY